MWCRSPVFNTKKIINSILGEEKILFVGVETGFSDPLKEIGQVATSVK